jgi:hypothetical protein
MVIASIQSNKDLIFFMDPTSHWHNDNRLP